MSMVINALLGAPQQVQNEVVNTHADDLENAAQADDLDEVASIGAHRIGG